MIDFSLSTLENEIGGGSFFATDSRFGSLWVLSIGNEGPITDPRDLIVAFQSAPILFLNDDSVVNHVRSGVTMSGGTARLTSFQLFSTRYLVDEPIEYGFGLEADIVTAVPAPSTLTLLGLGVLGFAGYTWRGWVPRARSAASKGGQQMAPAPSYEATANDQNLRLPSMQ